MKRIWPFKLALIFLLFVNGSWSQNDSVWTTQPEVTFSGFADVFYVFDFNLPTTVQRQDFLFNHNRHNEFNLNLGLLKWKVEHAKYRSNFAVQAGTYANDNYSAEPGLLKSIAEANIGISLGKANKLWLDAGVLPSYIGFESAISMDNPTLTRSLLAENSPYFMTGAQLSYKPNDHWMFAGLIVNGWQRIQRIQGNSLLSFGTQVNYRKGDRVTLNWSTFVGTDDPDSTRRMRYFSNLYGQFKIKNRFELIAGFDLGFQQRSKNAVQYDNWLSPVVIGQYTFNKKWKTALRAEYYSDETAIILFTGTKNGFKTTGLSLNVDFSPFQQIMWRMEGRWLNSKDALFKTTGNPSYNNFFVGTSIAIKFSQSLMK